MKAEEIDSYAKDLAGKLMPYISRQIDRDVSYYESLELAVPSDDDKRLIAWDKIVELLYDCNRDDIPAHAELRIAKWIAQIVLIRALTFAGAKEASQEAEADSVIQSVTALSTSVTYATPIKRSALVDKRLQHHQATADEYYRKLVHSLRKFPRWQI